MKKNEFGYWEHHWKAYIRDKCICVYCGFDGTIFENWRQLSIDHIIPEKEDGEDSLNNIAVACRRCNDNKGDFDPRGKAGKLNLSLTRENLLAKAKESTEQKNEKELPAFKAMMKEIKEQ